MRRRIGICIDPKELLTLIRKHYQFSDGEPFPHDMGFVEGTYDFDTDKFKIKVVSVTFKDVPEGHAMPYLDVIRKQ